MKTLDEIKFVRINENYEIHMTVDHYEKVDEQFVEEPQGKFRLTTYKTNSGITLYTFGYTKYNKNQKPDHGGEWSSNSTCINEKFGVKIIECAVKSIKGDYPNCLMAMACDIEWAKSVMPKVLEWRVESVYTDGSMYQPKNATVLPRGNDYFNSTVLDINGDLVYPNVKSMEKSIADSKRRYGWGDTHPMIQSWNHWITILKAKEGVINE